MITTKERLANRATALKALKHRRDNPPKKIDNGSLYAGSPMYFYCKSCEAEIVVPENYLSKPSLCGPCSTLKELGWLK